MMLGLATGHRDGQGRPVNDATLTLIGNGIRVEGRTHADGIWDFFPGVSAPQAGGSAALYIQSGRVTAQAQVPIPGQGDGREGRHDASLLGRTVMHQPAACISAATACTSSSTPRKAGSRCPTSGVAWAASTRGWTFEGPGPSSRRRGRTRSGTSGW